MHSVTWCFYQRRTPPSKLPVIVTILRPSPVFVCYGDTRTDISRGGFDLETVWSWNGISWMSIVASWGRCTQKLRIYRNGRPKIFTVINIGISFIRTSMTSKYLIERWYSNLVSIFHDSMISPLNPLDLQSADKFPRYDLHLQDSEMDFTLL